MSTIFQQILDSEQIFKAQTAEIASREEILAGLNKRLNRLKTDVAGYKDNNLELKACITNKSASRIFLVNRSKILTNQLKSLSSAIADIKSEYSTNLSIYEESRKELTSFLNHQSELFNDQNSKLKFSDPSRYDKHCDNIAKLDTLKKDIETVEMCLITRNRTKDEFCTRLKTKVDITNQLRKNIEMMKNEIDQQEFSTAEKDHINKLKLSVLNFESDISSMMSEITSKKLYVQNIKNSREKFLPTRPSNEKEGIHLDNSTTRTFSNYFPQPFNPYCQSSSSRSKHERTVVAKPTNLSSTPDEVDMFGDDDDLLSTQVIRACEEAEKKGKQSVNNP